MQNLSKKEIRQLKRKFGKYWYEIMDNAIYGE